MTFIITELSNFDDFSLVVMAADSSEVDTVSGMVNEAEKIIYFPELNIGISTWGHSEINGKNINDLLTEWVNEFFGIHSINEVNGKNKFIKSLSKFLAEKLNSNNEHKILTMGLHVAGFDYSEQYREFRPAIYHIHNHDALDKQEIDACYMREHHTNPLLFVAEPTNPCLRKNENTLVRNGIYKEFALFYSKFDGLRREFVNIISRNHSDLVRSDINNDDLIKVEAEGMANWVRLMCSAFSEAGLYPYIGKKIKVLVILENNHKWFFLDEFKENNVVE